jgi:hypothetical protein
VAAPEEELRRIFGYLGRPAPTPGEMDALVMPSAVSLTAVHSGGAVDRIGSWTQSLSPEEIRRTIDLVGRFGLGRLYGADPMPRVDGGEAAFEPP